MTTAMVYFVLPAYNEARSLSGLLPRIKHAMETKLVPFKVIVVNDGSTDNTLRIAEDHAALMPLMIIDHEQNRGLGEALKSGLIKASTLARPDDVIVVMDADNTHPPELVTSMVDKLMQGHDIVIASRFVDGGRQVGVRIMRRMLSRSASMLLRTLFPMAGVSDYTSGFRAYSAGIIRRSLDVYGASFIEERGFSCFVDLLLKLHRLGVRACEVPLVLRYDFKEGASKMQILRTILCYLRLIARNRVQLPFAKVPFSRA